MLAHIDLGQHDARDVTLGLAHVGQGVDRGVLAGLVPLHHEQHLVGESRHDLGVGHAEQRRRIQHDEVEALAQLAEQHLHLLAAEQIGRVGGLALDRQIPEARLLAVDERRRRARARPPCTRPSPCVGRGAEIAMHVGMAQIDVHQQDPLAGARGKGGEAQGEGRLAFLRQGRRDQDHLRRIVDVGELQRRIDRTDRFGVGGERLGHQILMRLADCPSAARAAAPAPAPAAPGSARPAGRCAGRCRTAP